jgi:glutathione S-transferase
MFDVPQLTLYFRYSCFFCRRVMAELEELGLMVEMRSVDEYDHLSQLVDGGGMQQVPALLMTEKDGTESWMYESNDILHYLRDLGARF